MNCSAKLACICDLPNVLQICRKKPSGYHDLRVEPAISSIFVDFRLILIVDSQFEGIIEAILSVEACKSGGQLYINFGSAVWIKTSSPPITENYAAAELLDQLVAAAVIFVSSYAVAPATRQ